jgi:hypothetical protein
MIRQPLLNTTTTTTTQAIVLNAVQGWSNNFYHSLIEIGGRISLLLKYVVHQKNQENSKHFTFLIPKRTTIVNSILGLLFYNTIDSTHFIEYLPKEGIQYDITTLKWADWDSSPSSSTSSQRAKNRLSPYNAPYNTFIPSSLALSLLSNNILLSTTKDIDNDMNTIVFISRHGSKRGGIIGETMLFQGLIDEFQDDYSIILFQGHELTLMEQTKIFNSATGIVGVHGGGFSNIIFSKSGTIVIEIPLQPLLEGPYFKEISKLLKLCYVNTRNIFFRYIDNIMIFNEHKIKQIITLMKRSLSYKRNGKNIDDAAQTLCPPL